MIIKRDGRRVPFNREKISIAIMKSIENSDIKLSAQEAKSLSDQIANSINAQVEELSVEDIQDKVVELLNITGHKDIAYNYNDYRKKRTIKREQNSSLMVEIGKKLTASDVQNQNANVDEYSFGGRKGEADSALMKYYALNWIMSEKSRYNHTHNRIYIHDLDSYVVGMHNCLTIPFDKILAKGFNTRQTDVRPANSVNTAFQLVAVLFQLQSLQQFGGVAASHLDHTMVPYVRKSFLKHYIAAYIKDSEEFLNINLMNLIFETYEDEVGIERNRFDDWVDDHKKDFFEKTGLKESDFKFSNKSNLNPKYYQQALYDTVIETQQAAEGMYHNLNTLQSRSGNQLPFTSINYGTCTSEEGRLVIKSLIMGSIKGVGKLHKTSIFPCGIFQCMKGINRKPEDPNYDLYDLATKSTARRLYPNYANCDWSGNAGYDPNDPKTFFSTMGCRTANGYDINGFGQLKDGRGNICPVTIIMPTLAMEAKEIISSSDSKFELVEEFMSILDKAIFDAKDMLIERFDYICSQSSNSAKFMYENGMMEGYIPEEGIRSALKHGTLALGQLGLAETLQILIGCDHTEERGMALAKRIEQLFKDRCSEFKQQYKLNFGVYMTPAENLCYTAMQKFKEKYGIIPNVSENDFFTNSMHVPVWKEISPFEKIDIESQLTGYSSAGSITYVELDSAVQHNISAVKTIIDYAMDHDIPYFALNVPNDTCLDCGSTGLFTDTCPQCGSSNIQRLRRVTGYLTGDYKTAFNKGKQQEVEMRYKHSKKMH
jgi:ribonucleoside-triphosphate reductase